jgi:hypothetical protein
MARSPPGKLQPLQRPRALHVRARCTAWIATLRTQRHDTRRMEVLLRLVELRLAQLCRSRAVLLHGDDGADGAESADAN